jgi:4-hydroxy-3-polyprenylbenzoate decarboxylase
MSYTCLADFLEELARSGELVRVEATVDLATEAAEIARQHARKNGGAVLFSSPAGRDIPLLVDLLTTEERICRALGVVSLDEVAARVESLLDAPEAEGWFEKLKTAPTRTLLGKMAPRTSKSGPCQRVVLLGEDIDLARLPVPRARLEENYDTITAGQLHLADARTGRRYVGRHDLSVLDANRLAVHWAAHDPAARLFEEYAARGEPMPVAIVLGGDPAGLLAAMAPLPCSVDACAVAGLLRDRPIELVTGRTVTIPVPTEAEIVIEGTIDPREPTVACGPICTPLGQYTPAAPCPVIRVTALTHRANAVFPALLHGPPPNEHVAITRAMQRVFLPMTRLAIPELVDQNLPAFGGGRQVAWLSIRKTHAGQARRVAQAFWGLTSMMFAKLLVIVDEDVDVHDGSQVGAAVASNMDPGRDVFFEQGPPDPWDAATPPGTLGQKMAIDATKKLLGEGSGTKRT